MARLDDGATRLRSGCSVWQADKPVAAPVETVRPREPRTLAADIAIIGAGITGSFLAERFTRGGARVVVIDRHTPATGSTAASTAMLLWELDASLLELEDRLGLEAARNIAGDCRLQVARIGALVNELGIACDYRPRPSLYLAGDKLDAADLREEQRIRAHLEIPSRYLDDAELAANGMAGEAALLSEGSAETDPVRLARGLLAAAMARGAVVHAATAAVYGGAPDGVMIETREGDVVKAGALVLANGYEMPDFVPVDRHRLASSWAIATAAGVRLPVEAMIWEAADPYLYMRTTADGRVIIGGEDEELAEARAQEKLMPAKIEALLGKAAGRCPGLAGVDAEFAWSGVFGETNDSLPLIGRVPGRPNTFAAFGYGGNGITFSALAASLLEAEMRGNPHPHARLYALDRD